MGIEPTSEVWEVLECTSLTPPPTIQISPANVRSNSVPRHHPNERNHRLEKRTFPSFLSSCVYSLARLN
jgi:hypothetical protein